MTNGYAWPLCPNCGEDYCLSLTGEVWICDICDTVFWQEEFQGVSELHLKMMARQARKVSLFGDENENE